MAPSHATGANSHAVNGMTSNSYLMACFPRAFCVTLTTERPIVIVQGRRRGVVDRSDTVVLPVVPRTEEQSLGLTVLPFSFREMKIRIKNWSRSPAENGHFFQNSSRSKMHRVPCCSKIGLQIQVVIFKLLQCYDVPSTVPYRTIVICIGLHRQTQ